MKKINSKGFTLIELLAVIVVLAIIMVIATTTILNSTSNAAGNSFVQSARTIADFVSKQNQLLAGDSTGSNNESCYNNWSEKSTSISNRPFDTIINEGGTSSTTSEDTVARCWGINSTDYDLAESEISINGDTGEVEVKLCAKSGGRFENITGEFDGVSVTTGPCVTVTK